jgi:hypothetical protein
MHTVCAAVLGSQLPISAPISFSFSQAETIPPEQLSEIAICKVAVDAAGDQPDRLRPMQTPAPIGATDRPADYAARISAT